MDDVGGYFCQKLNRRFCSHDRQQNSKNNKPNGMATLEGKKTIKDLTHDLNLNEMNTPKPPTNQLNPAPTALTEINQILADFNKKYLGLSKNKTCFRIGYPPSIKERYNLSIDYIAHVLFISSSSKKMDALAGKIIPHFSENARKWQICCIWIKNNTAQRKKKNLELFDGISWGQCLQKYLRLKEDGENLVYDTACSELFPFHLKNLRQSVRDIFVSHEGKFDLIWIGNDTNALLSADLEKNIRSLSCINSSQWAELTAALRLHQSKNKANLAVIESLPHQRQKQEKTVFHFAYALLKCLDDTAIVLLNYPNKIIEKHLHMAARKLKRKICIRVK